MTRGDEDIEGGSESFKRTEREALKTMLGWEGGLLKVCILQNQHDIIQIGW